MENPNECPKLAKCPIYQKNVFKNEKAGESYRNLYCLAGERNYSNCKRYIVSNRVGKPAPDTIMPNTSLSVEEIIAKM